MRTSATAAAITLLPGLLLVAPTAAFSHRIPREYSAAATLRLGGDGTATLDVLLSLALRPGTESRRTLARYDLNHDQKLDGPEQILTSNAFGAEVVGGFALRASGRPVAPERRAMKASARVVGGRVVIAALLRYPLRLAPGAELTLDLRVLDANPKLRPRVQPSLLTTVSIWPPLRVTAPPRQEAGGGPKARAATVEATLLPGGPALRVRVLRPLHSPPPEPAAESSSRPK